MPDDGLYGAVGRVCGGIGVGQDVSRVEYIQALVSHGAHIEIVCGHDHEAIQIQFQTKTVFIPLDRAVQAVQGPFSFVSGAGVAEYLQQGTAATACLYGLLAAVEVASYQREQIRSEEHTSELQSLMRTTYA